MGCDLQILCERLRKEGQTHLLRHLDTLSGTERETFLAVLAGIDFSYLKRGESSPRSCAYEISPIDIFTCGQADLRREELEQTGLSAIREGKVAAVLLCGGQGTRLGFDYPKGMYDIGITRSLPIFGFHFAYLCEVARRAGAWFPIFIMTSRTNDGQIQEYLKVHNHFGFCGEYVRTYIQNMVPATDFDGKILLAGKTSLVMSPDGNGGRHHHVSLVAAGCHPPSRPLRQESGRVCELCRGRSGEALQLHPQVHARPVGELSPSGSRGSR